MNDTGPDNPNISQDASGEWVVTVQGTPPLPWWAWVLLGVTVYGLFRDE